MLSFAKRIEKGIFDSPFYVDNKLGDLNHVFRNTYSYYESATTERFPIKHFAYYFYMFNLMIILTAERDTLEKYIKKLNGIYQNVKNMKFDMEYEENMEINHINIDTFLS